MTLPTTRREAATLERHLLECLADYRATRHPSTRAEILGLIPTLKAARAEYRAAWVGAALAGELEAAA